MVRLDLSSSRFLRKGKLLPFEIERGGFDARLYYVWGMIQWLVILRDLEVLTSEVVPPEGQAGTQQCFHSWYRRHCPTVTVVLRHTA
jgi:hypothetical protein